MTIVALKHNSLNIFWCERCKRAHIARCGTVEARESAKRMNRFYELVAVNDRTGFEETVTREPVTQHEAYVMRSKFNPHRDVRFVLREVQA